MADLNYVAEKFHVAVHCLVSDKPLQQRVYNAYMSFHPIKVEDFKNESELQEAYKQIMDSLTVVEGAPGEGRVPATIKQMSDSDAAKLIDSILSFTFLVDAERRSQGY
jgi:hypothetical protein